MGEKRALVYWNFFKPITIVWGGTINARRRYSASGGTCVRREASSGIKMAVKCVTRNLLEKGSNVLEIHYTYCIININTVQ